MLSQEFRYDQNSLDKLTLAISPARLASYVAKAGSEDKAIELYLWNTAVSEALYSPLQGLEVLLRNSLDRQLSLKYGTEWYKQNARPVVFLDPQFERIQKAMKDFDKNRPITNADVVANLSFGFWADILHYEMYDPLWRSCLHHAFPNKPKGTKRSTVGPIVKRLKDLRNRVAHHEPIWKWNLQREHTSIIEIASWLCPVTSSWIAYHSRVERVLRERPK